LCLATDLGMGLPLEHGLQSTLVAMRLADHLGVDSATASQTYYGCLLFHVGCTVDAEVSAGLFRGDLLRHFNPVMFGTQTQTMAGIMRALADPDSVPPLRALQAVGRLPMALRGHRDHIAALCEVATMLSERLCLPADVQQLFAHFTDRWDGKGPAGLKGEELELSLRIVHVARDAALQRMVGGVDYAARVIGERGGGAFDPAIASRLVADAADILAWVTGGRCGMRFSRWNPRLARCCVGRRSTRCWPRWAISLILRRGTWLAIRTGWRSWRPRQPNGAVASSTRRTGPNLEGTVRAALLEESACGGAAGRLGLSGVAGHVRRG